MNKVISLVAALTPRACNVAEAIAGRMSDAGLWRGYTASEGLIGELRLDSLLTFHRPGQPHAVLVFRTPRMTGMRQVDWGDPVVLEANVGQRYTSHVLLDQPGTYNQQLSHTFAKTRTLAEQVKAGLEATLKVGAEAGAQGGIHGITAKVYAELTAKIYGEYQRQWGEASTESDTVSDSFTRVVTPEELTDGPVRLEYEAVRMLNREQRTIRADCDYEHSVELIDETGAGASPPYIQLVCPSWAAFRNVVQGFAARDTEIERDGQKHIQPTAFYREFIGSPIRGGDLDALSAPAKGAIELVVDYDNVLTRDIRII